MDGLGAAKKLCPADMRHAKGREASWGSWMVLEQMSSEPGLEGWVKMGNREGGTGKCKVGQTALTFSAFQCQAGPNTEPSSKPHCMYAIGSGQPSSWSRTPLSPVPSLMAWGFIFGELGKHQNWTLQSDPSWQPGSATEQQGIPGQVTASTPGPAETGPASS